MAETPAPPVDISEKEKETAQQDEKDQDTASRRSQSPKAKSPTGSKPGSAKSGAKSKPGSAKSAAGSTRSGSAKSQAKSSTRGSARSSSPKSTKSSSHKNIAKAKKKQDEVRLPEVSPLGEGEEDMPLPDGAKPIFLSSPTQKIFDCLADEDVTATHPYKLIKKEDILKDLFNRAAVCDFHPFKKVIEEFPEDEILLCYDADFKHGQNFLIAATPEAKHAFLNPKKRAGSGIDGEEDEEGSEEAEEVVYRYIPPVSKEWISLGSEREIEEESLVEHRPRISMTVKRKRREFGAPCKFSDRNVADAKDGYIECLSYEDRSFDLKRIELDKSVQAIPEFSESSAQTDWKYPRNANTQYEPRLYEEEKKEEILKLEDVEEFAKNVAPRFDLALQQNEIMDVFYDDWTNLADRDSSFGSKADNHLKEYQSFTDLQFSKDKTITCIDWHPNIRGVVAVAVGERLSFDDRIDHAHRIIMTPSLVLIWSFADPIHPQLILEAPDDILSFKFSPTDPNIICGGCINGQIVLWDISQHAERLKQPRGGKRKDNMGTLPGFEDESALDTPIVRYCAVSSIEHSHRAPVTDIMWIPDHFELNRMGVPQESKTGQCIQIMSCATDHVVMVWDTRPPKQAQQHHHQQQDKQDEHKNPMGIPTTFKHLDLTWKPHLKVTLSKSEPGGDHAPLKFSIAERQGDKSVLNTADDSTGGERKATDTMAGGYSFGSTKPGSGKRTLTNMKTHFYVGTEDGEIVYVDWMPQKDQDSGKIQTPKPEYYHSLHDGPVNTMQRSPFFKDIVLCVGGWTFSLWKEGINSGPILTSASSSKRFTAGHWSPSRPAVFYITKQDGSVDIWDLLDRTHEPSMNQSVSPSPITAIFPYQVTNKQHLLAVGDSSGTLHILEIPWSLRQPTPNEELGMSNYFDREVRRRGFVVARWDFREKEKMEIEMEKKNKAGIAPNVTLTEDELEYRMKMEYAAYMEEEASFLRSLGLKEDVDEPLPQMD